MERYQSGKPIDFIIPLIDEQGEKFAATSVDVELFDESETSIHTDTLTPEVDAETVTATVDETLATITNGMNSEVRRLKVYLKSADTTIERDMYFMLEKTHAIVPTENSFVTYLESLRLMPEFPTFVAMNSATEDMRKSALIAAHRNIGMLEIADGAFKNADGEAFRTENGKSYWTTQQLTADDFANLDATIRKNLQYAQMLEAEHLLGGDGTEDLRAKGVMSYTVGEVKQFFRTSKPLDLVVSKHALRYIGRYVQYNRRLSRV